MLDESSYGEFLLWSPNGKVAYINAIEDRTYSEVKDLLLHSFEAMRSDPFKAAEVLQELFGPVACDPDPSGAPYMIGAQPPCPNCAGGRIASWELIHPAKVVEWDIPIVTHERWDRMNEREKIESVWRYLAASGFATTAR